MIEKCAPEFVIMRLQAGVEALLLTALALSVSGQEEALHRVKRLSEARLRFPNFNQSGTTPPSTGNRDRHDHNRNVDIGEVIGSVIGSFLNPNQNNNILSAVAGLNQILIPGLAGGIPAVSDEDIVNGLRHSPDHTFDLGRSNTSSTIPDNTVLGTFYVGNLPFSLIAYGGSLMLVLEQQGNCGNGNGGCEQGCQQQGQFTRCFCNAGFVLNRDRRTCSDINECMFNNAGCSHICNNTPGSFTCACVNGFTLLVDIRSCGQTSPGGSTGNVVGGCAINNGGCQQKCIVNDNGRAVCRCDPGYRLNQVDKKTCDDIDKCKKNNGGCSDYCINTVGSNSCSCNGNLVLGPNGKTCVEPPPDRTDGGTTHSCHNQNGGCEQICSTTRKGRVRCRCRQGFTLKQDQVSCSQDLNVLSCAVQNGGCEQGCRMVRDSARCFCNPGYTLDDDGISCNDVDECLVNNGGCQRYCINDEGSFRCTCDGADDILQSDLRSCGSASDGKFCSENNGGCQQGCTQLQNSVKCFCRLGFALDRDGRTCQDLDECVLNNAGCSRHCVNTDGFFRCECNARETLQADGKTCVSTALTTIIMPTRPTTPTTPTTPTRPTTSQTTAAPPSPTQSPVCNNAAPFSLLPLPGICVFQNGGCQQYCQQTLSGVVCSCRDGFTLQSDGRSCSNSLCTRCGVSGKSLNMTTKIVGGVPSSPKDWPWMVALLQTRNSAQFCGGALITSRHVLTAGHCVQQFTASGITVRVGEYDFSSNTDNSPKDVKVVEILAHEQYDIKTQENDIAILRLENDVSFNEFVQPVCLPPADNKDLADTNSIVTGWGTTTYGGPVSNVLREVTIPIWTRAACESTYPGKVFPFMMCAGAKAGGKDSCQGDSGGPLVTQYPGVNTWYLVGVVSWGIECARADRPGVYTRVNQYLPWIAQKTSS